MSKRYISTRFIDFFRPGDDITDHYDAETLEEFSARSVARVEEAEPTPLDALRERAKAAGIDHYWLKNRDTLLAEMEEE